MKKENVSFLIVEDDELDVEIILRAFKLLELNNKVVVARDGIEALEVLRGENGKEKIQAPFIILLDVKMPRMNGIEFLETLRSDKVLRRSIVFMLTTSNNERDRLAAFDHNVSGYLLKDEIGTEIKNKVMMLSSYINQTEFPPQS